MSLSSLENGRHRRVAPIVRGLALLNLTFQSLGIIYSDIGTSPLYVLNGLWSSSGPAPSKDDVIGGVSAIIWAILLLPLLKYVIISLRFGTTEGEGGTFALYHGLYPPEDKDFDADRTLTGDSDTNGVHSSSKGSTRIQVFLRWPLMIWALFGTSLTMADGIFTPAVSVTSAVGGIAVAKPSVSQNIIPISIALVVALFLVQKFGTSKIAFMFAPISFIWFLLLAGCGIYNITMFPGIFRAFDPSRAVMLFVRTKNYDLLAGILLAVTGCEAIFANLGQFNALSIQISFAAFVCPSLILAYLGQGARLIVDGDIVIGNIFYQTIPGPRSGALFWITFTFAILATIVASQALITATFSLVQQVVHLKGLPSIRMYHTSETFQGQIYIPVVNWLLMIAVIVVIGAFSNLAALTNAYGFSVATVMIVTTVLLAFQVHYVKRLPVILGVAFFVGFGFIDGLFWGASLKKVPHGAWVPLMLGGAMTLLMILWTWAKGLEDEFDGASRQNLRHLILQDTKIVQPSHPSHPDLEPATEQDYYYLAGPQPETLSLRDPKTYDERARCELVRIPTCAIFHKMAGGPGVPHSFVALIRQWPALPQVLIFLSVSVLPVARVPAEERYNVTKVRSLEGFYGVTYYVGFRDGFDVKIGEIIDKICDLETGMDPADGAQTAEDIRRIATSATNIVPHYHVLSRRDPAATFGAAGNWIRKYLIEDIYRRLSSMFPETANWLTPADQIIHVGINATI